MCFRPSEFQTAGKTCPACGAEVGFFDEACPECGEALPQKAAPATPGRPGAPKAPGMPGAPGAPAAPGMPKAPGQS